MEEFEDKALSFLKSGEYEKAAQIYVQLAVQYPEDDKFLISAANCYDRLGDKKLTLSLYKKALNICPQSLTAILNISTLYYELKKYDLSEKYAKQALEIKKDNFSAIMNLGNICYSRGEFGEALHFYEMMYKLNPNSYNAIVNIANACYNLREYLRAIDFALLAMKKRPTNVDPYIIAGNCYAELQKNEDAAKCFKKAIEIAPNSDWLCSSIAILYQKNGNLKQGLHYAWKSMAIKGNKTPADEHINFGYMLYEAFDEGEEDIVKDYLLKWQTQFQENPIVNYVCSALKNDKSTTQTDLTYLKKLFDGFAETFDEILRELNYRVPEFIAGALKSSLKIKLFKKRRILDLGCGTGLCTEALQTYFPNEEFYGVDVSEKMLNQADTKGIYKQLFLDDIMNFLQNNNELYHAIVAGDVLTYMGELKPLFNQLINAVKFGGFLCFSISKNTFNQDNYYLTPSGRFVHSLAYVKRILKYCGFEVLSAQEQVLRNEGVKGVEGYIILAQKKVEVVFE